MAAAAKEDDAVEPTADVTGGGRRPFEKWVTHMLYKIEKH